MEKSLCCMGPRFFGGGSRHPTCTEADSIGCQDVKVEMPGLDDSGAPGKYEPFPSPGAPALCGMCEEGPATRHCEECDAYLCDNCEQVSHSKGIFKLHNLRDVDAEAEDLMDGGHEKAEGGGGGHGHGTEEFVERLTLTSKDWAYTGLTAFLSLAVVIIMCVWSQGGLMAKHRGVHTLASEQRPGEVEGSLYRTPVTVNLPGTETAFFEVRLIGGAIRNFSQPAAGHRRLGHQYQNDLARIPRQLSGVISDSHSSHAAAAPTGTLTYTLLADDKPFFTKTVSLSALDEIEDYQSVDVEKLGFSGASNYYAKVTSERSDGTESGFEMQVVRMPSSGRNREVIGILIFAATFAVIIAEPIHRVYAAMMGASAALAAVSAIQETVSLEQVMQMIDFATMTLLFSMMILMRMVQETGFFNWLGIRMVKICKGDPKRLFFAMTMVCGIISMFLDTVTTTLLFGPLTYTLCKQMKLNPRPYYLSMVMNAVVGGSGTLIGDPPNMVLASKLNISFMAFLYYNFPIVLVMLPISSYYLYYRFQDILVRGKPDISMEQLELDNRIVDMPKCAKLGAIFSCVLLAMFLSPVHNIEPGWFAVMAMFAAAMMVKPHNIHHYLEIVEWDTLLFFALLFVLIECLAHLGVIALIAKYLIATITAFPPGMRTPAGLIIVLWVSTAGGCFLESLPFCTAIAYVLMDIKESGTEIEGIDPQILVWPLSIGVVVGGIGTILGSSANLVCLTVSYRYGTVEEDFIKTSDFPKYGMPLLVGLIILAMLWQLVLFAMIRAPAAP